VPQGIDSSVANSRQCSSLGKFAIFGGSEADGRECLQRADDGRRARSRRRASGHFRVPQALIMSLTVYERTRLCAAAYQQHESRARDLPKFHGRNDCSQAVAR
jgi:hypothetical protein